MPILLTDNWCGEVPSERLGVPPYHVDLLALNGNGACNCMDFVTKRMKLIKQGVMRSDHTRCKHLIAFRAYCMQVVIDEAIKQRTRQNKGRFEDDGH